MIARPARIARLAVALVSLSWPIAWAAQPAPVPLASSRLAMPGAPFSAAATLDGGTLLVSLSLPDTGAVAIVGLAGRPAVLRVLPLTTKAMGLALSHDGRSLAIAAKRQTLVLDIGRLLQDRGDPVIARFAGEQGAISVAFSPDDRLLAIAEQDAGQVTLVVPAHADIAPRSITVGQEPVGLAFSLDGRTLYVTSQVGNEGDSDACDNPRSGISREGTVSAIDLPPDAAPELEGQIMAGCQPVRIALSRDGATAFVTQRGDDRVTAYGADQIRQGRRRTVSRVAVGDAPVGMALSADGRTLWVANSNRFSKDAAGSLMRLAVAPDGTLSRTDTLPSGLFPRELTLLPDGRTLVAALFGSHALQIEPVLSDAVPVATRR